MALETGTVINDLVTTNPPGTDPKSQGDDHLRLIKTVAKNTFPGFLGSILVTGTDGGAVNAYTVTPVIALPAYASRMVVFFAPTIANTGAATLNISGLGVKDIKSVSGAALVANDLAVGTLYAAFYNGTEFRLLSITKNYADQLVFGATLPSQAGNAGKVPTTDGGAPGVVSWTDTFTIPWTFTNRLDEAKGADIASAATVNLSTATGNLIHITGTTTITAFTIPSGAERTVVFDGILTLTHHATTLILPTGANITTAAGDVAIVRGDGSGNARVVNYMRASGRSVIPAGWTLLAPPMTPTAAANVDALSIFSTAYDSYVIIGNGIKPAVSDNLAIRVGVAGAADTGNNYIEINASVPGSGTAATARWQLATSGANGLVLAAGRGINFEVHMQNVFDTSELKSMRTITSWQVDATPTYSQVIKGGMHTAANALTGIRLFWLAGNNFAAVGEIRIYGIINNP